MGVDIEFLNFGKPPVTSFSDTFLTAASFQANWTQGAVWRTPIVNPIWVGQASIGIITGGLNGLITTGVGSTNEGTFWPTFLLPYSTIVGLFGKNQFAQAKSVFASSVSGDIWAGPMVACTTVGGQGALYGWANLILSGTATPTWSMFKYFQGTFTENARGAAGAVAANDVLKVTCAFNAGDTTVTGFINGVQISQWIDNNASRPVDGAPGMVVMVTTAGPAFSAKNEWNNFSCGKA